MALGLYEIRIDGRETPKTICGFLELVSEGGAAEFLGESETGFPEFAVRGTASEVTRVDEWYASLLES